MAYPPATLGSRTNGNDANTGGDGAHAADHTAERAAIDDIVAHLGPDPAGTFPTVDERLDDVDTRVASIQSASTWQPSDQGFLAWTFDPIASPLNSQTLVSGTLEVITMACPPGTITGVGLDVRTAGSGLTEGFVGIYDSGGTLLRASADHDTDFQTVQAVEIPLSSPLIIATRQAIRIGIYVRGTTACALGRAGSGSVVNLRRTISDPRYARANTGLTTALPGTLGTMTLTNPAIWAGVY